MAQIKKAKSAPRRERREDEVQEVQAQPEPQNKRQAKERRERRASSKSFHFSNHTNLGVDPELMDKEKTYRWEKEENLKSRHERDWDIVQKDGSVVEDIRDDAMSGAYTRTVGLDEYGKPIKNVLIAKYKDWHERDRQKYIYDPIDEEERQTEEGNPQGSDIPNSYIPDEGKQALKISKAR